MEDGGEGLMQLNSNIIIIIIIIKLLHQIYDHHQRDQRKLHSKVTICVGRSCLWGVRVGVEIFYNMGQP